MKLSILTLEMKLFSKRFTMFMANPIPFQTWISPSNNSINNTTTQYSPLFSDTIQITINNVSTSDIGVWTFGASNFIGNISADIDLVVAVPPGPPTNLSSSINGGTVSLDWIAPTEIGNPPITHYTLQLTSTLGDVILVIPSNDTNFELTALVPNTQYNLAIRGESSIFPTTGDFSDILTFMTLPGPPDIRNATIISADGRILANWTFRHIGGVDKEDVDVSVQCRPALQEAEIESGTGSGLAPGELKESCNGGNDHCIDNSYTGSIKLGPVEAGEVYTCGMVASIDGHLEVFNLSDVTTLTGIPSVPYGDHKCIGSELTFTVASKWAGIASGSNHFHFNAFTSDGSINKTFDFMGYMNNQNVTITIGTIFNKTTIYITAANIYGTSTVQSYEIQNICSATLTMSQAMSTYMSTMVTPSMTVEVSSSSTNIVIIVVPVIVSFVVISVATVLAIVAAILMIKKKKKGKMKVTNTNTSLELKSFEKSP
ncbi:PREDICTED: uncharacterized protein LOC109580211 [Amphimedon queenslandica]|uniref:Fibronectin type-III domain-containing protein n=1 Tax=Amphimedon queenslandica TaxID=400682 RepID=A0A1X7VJ11_AMPQE|nr:PREDICTED: uncharacterized protein LOC109580211 [Amphimedon queenslandica]|eukprot:XP_019848700.1 PREDICTED: uncharacterized protein LOC109580211 [Amphimedon queenslandica]